jgi:hypothetical protein
LAEISLSTDRQLIAGAFALDAFLSGFAAAREMVRAEGLEPP